MPRPGTPVIHPSLGVHLRGVDEAAMPDECTITRASTLPNVFDSDTGRSVPPIATLVWSGRCRVEARQTVQVAGVGDEPVTLRAYDIAVPVDVDLAVVDDTLGVLVDDVFTLTSSRSTWLIDRPLRITDVTGDTVETERHLVCEDHLG